MDASRSWHRFGIASLTVAVLVYSALVLRLTATEADIGLRCLFSTLQREAIDLSVYRWTPDRPEGPTAPGPGDVILSVGPPPGLVGAEAIAFADYTDFVRALKEFRRWRQAGADVVPVVWRGTGAEGPIHRAEATLRDRPLGSWYRSVIWFLQELIILAIGARVFWTRPRDESARLFFVLCAVTVVAYVGGYHWSEIVVSAPLIYLFAGFGILMPALSLHFYLAFPTALGGYARHPGRVLGVLYGVPLLGLMALWAAMARLTLSRDGPTSEVLQALEWVRVLALANVGLAAITYGLCLACLAWRAWRPNDAHERDQIKWIWWASLLSTVPIGMLLAQAAVDPASLGRERAAWLMFVASLLYTTGYALSITRYKLLQVDRILSRSAAYIAVSVAAGLLYSGILVATAALIGDRLRAGPTSREAMLAGATALALLVLSGAARGHFQRAIDRRFHREKYKFDLAMARMGEAVGSLVDHETSARRLLGAAGEVLRLEWATVWQRQRGGSYVPVASLGAEPEEKHLPADHPLVARLAAEPERPVTLPRASDTSDPTADALIRLGGEVAYALRSGGGPGPPEALLVLGPKRSGLPYAPEELAFSNALVSVAGMALHSADIQRTLGDLNLELSRKVEKIAEQQRRISALEREREAPIEAAVDLPTPVPPSMSAFLGAGPAPADLLVGSSPAMRRVLELVAKVAPGSSSVLITGESGTGKELVARAIHRASPRAEGPFVSVHCAALSRHLLESELFGHVKGAFTGADRDRIGRFQQAEGGTLLLDEIGDISLEVQVKLLRVLQEKRFELVGSSRTIGVDVRILAATHQDLTALIKAGRFREDLYYRLNVIGMRTPALRDRMGDLPALVAHLVARHSARGGRPAPRVSGPALEALSAYAWPGNVRELENVIERALVLTEGGSITLEALPPELVRAGIASAAAAGEDSGPSPEDQGRARLLAALRAARGNKAEAARLVGLPRSTFFSQLRRHGIG